MATKPALCLIPSGVKQNKVYSVLPSNGDGDFTFSRSGNATRVNKDGFIEEVGSNVPRLNYPLIDGVVSGCPSLLLEPARTNIIPYSEDFTNAEWAKSNLTVLGNQVISPDGTLSADKVSSNTSNSTHFLQEFLSTGNTVNVSVFVKNEDADYIQLTNPSSGGIFINFDIKNGLIGSKGSLISNEKIENYGNGWYRISATLDNTGVDNRYIRFYIVSSANASFNQSWQPSSNISFYIWGGQAELNSYSTSYIPTSGSQTTRSAETCNNAGDVNTFNDSEGVLMAEISGLSSSDTSSRRLGITKNGTYEGLRIYMGNGTIGVAVFDGAANQYSKSVNIDNSIFHKVALKYKTNDFALWIDGIEYQPQSSGITFVDGTLDDISFDYVGGNHFYSNTKQIQYFDTALTDTDLEELTSWTSFNEMAQAQLYKTY